MLGALLPVAALAADPAPLGLRGSPDYLVTVDGDTAFVYAAVVAGPGGAGFQNGSFVHITLPPSGEAAHVVVGITAANETVPVRTASLRPRGSPSVSLRSDASVGFSVDAPGHYLLEWNGEWAVDSMDTGLMIFVDKADPSPPSPSDPSVVFFPPGVHIVESGVLNLTSDTTTYLAPGAVVVARVRASNQRNITLKGSGVLAVEWLPGDALPFTCRHCGCPADEGIAVSNSTDVRIEGITMMHVNGWMLKLESVVGAHVSGTREIGWRCNNDGVDVVSSHNVVVENAFIRSCDDAIAVKATAGDTSNVTVRDSILYPHGNCMEVGFELLSDHVTGVTFERNQCWHQMMSAMSVHDGGHALVSALTFRDILVEGLYSSNPSHDISYGLKLLDLQITSSKYSGADINRRGSISNVTYSNVTYDTHGLEWLQSRFYGNSTAHAVADVSVDQFYIDGKLAHSLKDLGVVSNEFVRNVTFG